MFLLLHGEEEFELRGEFVLSVESVREVNSSDSAVSVNLNSKILNTRSLPQSFNVVSSICSSGEIRQVKLDLIPSFVQSHWHCTNEGFHSSRRLVVRSPKSSSNVLVIKHLHFKGEVLL